MPKLPVVSGKELYDLLLKYDCVHIRTAKSSHHIIENLRTAKRTSVPIHGSKDIGKGLFANILKQLGVDVDDFLDFMKKKNHVLHIVAKIIKMPVFALKIFYNHSNLGF